jgi:hypothetical protein
MISWMIQSLFILAACDVESEDEYERFNSMDDAVTISVGVEEPLAPIELELMSSTNEVGVGVVSIDPGGGPIGTEHLVRIEVYSEYAHRVDRASVEIHSDQRGVRGEDLIADSAAEGVFRLSLVSYGEDGEIRDDTFQIQLWDVINDDDQLDTSTR